MGMRCCAGRNKPPHPTHLLRGRLRAVVAVALQGACTSIRKLPPAPAPGTTSTKVDVKPVRCHILRIHETAMSITESGVMVSM